ncbi:MAG TPA: TorF family putative porin [Steroidobacteraceae bacterium]|nr:TorF family putative porin [Steroidobacteraceae bacterium]
MTLRLLPAGIAALTLSLIAPRGATAADMWGGSLALTSDYVVRGISRSNESPALQLDVHYLTASGFLAGAFASNTQIASVESKDVELDGFVGYVWSAGDVWRGRFLLSHYSYPWNQAGSAYDYDELDADVAFSDWLGASVTYSPDTPRYLRGYGLAGVNAESVEIDLQHPLVRKLSGFAGAGYARFGGSFDAGGGGYGYFSVGARYDLAPVSLVVSYVNTTAGAKTLFYDEAERGRVLATAIWRF